VLNEWLSLKYSPAKVYQARICESSLISETLRIIELFTLEKIFKIIKLYALFSTVFPCPKPWISLRSLGLTSYSFHASFYVTLLQREKS